MNGTRISSLKSATGAGKHTLAGNIKATREDWLTSAMDILIADGVGEVKVLAIARKLGVSRSSFYWYFKSRQDLLDALLEYWQATNTAALVKQSEISAKTITEAVCNVFRCFVNPDLFNNALDFAVRDWARRSPQVRKTLDHSDQVRVDALDSMFSRFGYDKIEALTRARILYFMQIGYNVAELNETMSDRMKLIPEYLLGFTGVEASQSEIEVFSTYAHQFGIE
ncbi:MAG: TetR/AcrR family transcriptional regulator [Hyphomicrobiales bacterium]|nr:TetR/AcrR family transcriptional regulator [Hyphomicrobiales bacterium]